MTPTYILSSKALFQSSVMRSKVILHPEEALKADIHCLPFPGISDGVYIDV